MDADNTTSEFPVAGVQDCATHPGDIDPMAMWMVQHKENETALSRVVRHKDVKPIRVLVGKFHCPCFLALYVLFLGMTQTCLQFV